MLRKLISVVRDGWLMVGITILMFLGLEGAYRLQSAIRGKSSGEPAVDSTQHPYAGQRWFHELSDGPNGVNAIDYRLDTYRGHWPAPRRSTFLNIDSAGRRLTVSRIEDSATAIRVFTLGGSSMWGFTSRDSFTIPSLLSQRLATRGFANVEVVNLAQAGFNATQEATGLLVELARGNIPDVAVFLDGYNDVASGIHRGYPGQAFSLEIAQRRVDLGKRGFWGELIGLGRHSRLIQRFSPSNRRAGQGGERDNTQFCGSIADYYRRVHTAIDGMASAYGVRTVTLLQPHHGITKKPLTEWEQSLGKATLAAQCMTVIDSTMSDRLGTSFFRAYQLFDGDTQTVFVDRDSHVTEEANGKIADYIAEILVPLLRDSTVVKS
jgi:hypothetical protein